MFLHYMVNTAGAGHRHALPARPSAVYKQIACPNGREDKPVEFLHVSFQAATIIIVISALMFFAL